MTPGRRGASPPPIFPKSQEKGGINSDSAPRANANKSARRITVSVGVSAAITLSWTQPGRLLTVAAFWTDAQTQQRSGGGLIS